MTSQAFRRGFLLALAAGVTGVFLWMIRPFLIALLLGAIFTSLAWPLYQAVLRRVGGRRRLASALTLAALLVAILLPATSLVGIVLQEAVKVTQTAAPWVRENVNGPDLPAGLLRRFPVLENAAPYTGRIAAEAAGAVSNLGGSFLRGAKAVTAGTLRFFVDAAIMLYAMFFFFVSGPDVLERIFGYLPLPPEDERRLLSGFRSMARATLRGVVCIGALQGTLVGLGFRAAGIPSALFWGTLAAALSILPAVGTALVWAPGCVYLFLAGRPLAAVLLAAWGAAVVGGVDNLLRPRLVGRDAKIPDLLVLVSTLGGLAMFGVEGFILGPCLALVFLTVWDIYGAAFADVLPGRALGAKDLGPER